MSVRLRAMYTGQFIAVVWPTAHAFTDELMPLRIRYRENGEGQDVDGLYRSSGLSNVVQVVNLAHVIASGHSVPGNTNLQSAGLVPLVSVPPPPHTTTTILPLTGLGN